VSRIALVKPEKARGVENMLLALAQRGQLGEPVSDAQLLGMLEKVNEGGGAAKAGITVRWRRKGGEKGPSSNTGQHCCPLTRGGAQINRRRPDMFGDDY